MYDPTGRTDAMLASLNGLWVGDCIGNIGQLYFAHDILKALDEGVVKLHSSEKSALDSVASKNKFQYSDDTEEAIVLVNHLFDRHETMTIDQDVLAKEFAERYYSRDPDGELFGYGLMTRKVLKDIYDGVDWRVANQTKPRIEGPSFVDKMLGGIVGGKTINESMAEVNVEIQKTMKQSPELRMGSCGNGSAMRVAPLGAWLYLENTDKVIEMAKLQAEVTHCHPEGIAGSIAITLLARQIANTAKLLKDGFVIDTNKKRLFDHLLYFVPKGQVWDGIKKASELTFDTPIGKLQEILGNGTHVTCQDTIPLCVFLTIRAFILYKREEMYEKALIDTCMCFGDVDTNCAIVGGMIGIISPPPVKWESYCEPMEGVLGEPFPENPRKPIQSKLGFDIDKSAITEAMKETQPWGVDRDEVNEKIKQKQIDKYSEYNKWLAQMETKPFIPNTGSCEAVAKMPPSFSELIEKRFPGKTYRV